MILIRIWWTPQLPLRLSKVSTYVAYMKLMTEAWQSVYEIIESNINTL